MALAFVILAVGAVLLYLGIKGVSLADFYTSLGRGKGTP